MLYLHSPLKENDHGVGFESFSGDKKQNEKEKEKEWKREISDTEKRNE
jgi:hypothetical protein